MTWRRVPASTAAGCRHLPDLNGSSHWVPRSPRQPTVASRFPGSTSSATEHPPSLRHHQQDGRRASPRNPSPRDRSAPSIVQLYALVHPPSDRTGQEPAEKQLKMKSNPIKDYYKKLMKFVSFEIDPMARGPSPYNPRLIDRIYYSESSSQQPLHTCFQFSFSLVFRVVIGEGFEIEHAGTDIEGLNRVQWAIFSISGWFA